MIVGHLWQYVSEQHIIHTMSQNIFFFLYHSEIHKTFHVLTEKLIVQIYDFFIGIYAKVHNLIIVKFKKKFEEIYNPWQHIGELLTLELDECEDELDLL